MSDLDFGFCKISIKLVLSNGTFLKGFLLHASAKTLSEKCVHPPSSNNHQAALLNVFIFFFSLKFVAPKGKQED